MYETAMVALDCHGDQIVSIHAKRTYVLLPSGKCTRSETQLPLAVARPPDSTPDEQAGAPWLEESDVLPMKPSTDLIVMADACPPRGAVEMIASIEIANLRREYRISGERRAIYHGQGSISFSAPLALERLPIRHESAYGGIDPTVPHPKVETMMDLLTLHPGVYPRNACGMGYVVYENAERIEGLLLPQIENPNQLVTPETLVTGGPENWWRQPFPWSCDWFERTWYPRCAYLGGFPDHIPEDDAMMPEIRMGWVNSQRSRLARAEATGDLTRVLDPRLTNAASPALVLPFLRGDEAVRLQGMTPDGDLIVQLPGERPRMQVRFEGRTYDVEVVPNRVLISADEMGVYIVWHGAWRTPRQLPDRFPVQGDTMKMELEGVDVLVDGRSVEPLG
jgi:hypothetical protein